MTFTQAQIQQALDALPKENQPVMTAIIGQLQAEITRIGDLKTFLQKELADAEDDLKEANGRVRQLEQRASADSWEGSVDRMSGAFDESELRGRDGWL